CQFFKPINVRVDRFLKKCPGFFVFQFIVFIECILHIREINFWRLHSGYIEKYQALPEVMVGTECGKVSRRIAEYGSWLPVPGIPPIRPSSDVQCIFQHARSGTAISWVDEYDTIDRPNRITEYAIRIRRTVFVVEILVINR